MGLIQVLSHFKVISQTAEAILAVDSMSLVRFNKLSGLYKMAASVSVTGSGHRPERSFAKIIWMQSCSLRLLLKTPQ